MKTNILVQYDGGGYDGCIWEWNYFYIDKQGVFHNIQSSGCAGIDNLQAATELIDNNGNSFSNKVYVYDVGSEQDIITFSNESHPYHVTGVLQWFEDYNSPDAEFFAVCSECGNHITECGDAATYGDRLFCYECYSVGQCPCCDEYVGDDNIVEVNPDEHNDHRWICSDITT